MIFGFGMRHSQFESIGNLLVDFIRENGLEKTLLEKHVVDALPKVLGAPLMKYVTGSEVKDGKLLVHVSSAALKQEMFIARFELVKKLNAEVGAEIIKDIRVLS